MDDILKATFDGSTGKLAARLELPAGTPRAYALFAHCFSCSKDIKAAREIARALKGEGFAVLRFDFTGLGGSEGDFANTNFSSNVEDLVRAADFLRREHEAPDILIGHSLGGAAALVAAAAIPEVKGVVTIGAPAEASHVVAQLGDKRAAIERDGAAQVRLAGRPFTIRKQFLDDLEQERVPGAAASLGKALLVLHAPLDDMVGIDNASRIFAAAKHPKSFVSLDDADHLLSRAADARYAGAVIAGWATRYIAAAKDAKPRAAPKALAAVSAAHGGARAVLAPGHPLAVALNVDGHAMTIDASAADGGEGLGPNPTRVVEAALAACSAMTMKLYANRKGWALAGVEVMVRRAPGADAHMARTLEKSITLDGALDDAQRARLREIAGRCPVHRMLAQTVAIISPKD